MDKRTYRLMGTMNLSQEEKGFVYPIFEKDGAYYFEHSNQDMNIQSFEKVDGIEHISKIERLESNELLQDTKREYRVDDKAIIAYQEKKGRLFIGTIEDMISYYENKNTNNPFTSMIIEKMKEERARKK